MLIIGAIVARLASGALQGGQLHGRLGFVAVGLLAGITSVLVFLLLSAMVAITNSAVQMIDRDFRTRSSAVKAEGKASARTFMRNLEGSMEFCI